MQVNNISKTTKANKPKHNKQMKPVQRMLASLTQIEGDLAKVLQLVAPRNKRGYKETAADITVSLKLIIIFLN